MSNGYTLRQLIEQRDALTTQIDAIKAEMRGEKLAEAIALIAEFEFTAMELGLIKTQHIGRARRVSATFKPTAKQAPRPPMYRDPKTGETWSGRGRAPNWIEGNRDEYLLNG